MPYTLQCRSVDVSVNQCLHFSTVLGAVIKRKQYSGITVESGTNIKSVKITGGPPIKQKSLTWFPLTWFLAYVRASGGFLR